MNLQDMKWFFEYFRIDQTVSDESGSQILQTLSVESSATAIPQALLAESSDRILIDFHKHFAHNKKFIMNYQVTMTREGPHVTALSTLI